MEKNCKFNPVRIEYLSRRGRRKLANLLVDYLKGKMDSNRPEKLVKDRFLNY